MLNGFAGYSLLDDQLSGTGLRIANAIILSIPVVGTWISSLVFDGPYPGTEILQRLFVAHILLIPAADRRAHRRAPRARHPPQAHAVPGPGEAGGQRRRPAAVADVHGQGRWAVLPGRLGAGRARRPGPDQRHLGDRPLPRRRRQLGFAARLVHGVDGGRPAPHAALGGAGLRLPDPQPVLPGGAAALDRVRDHVRLAVHPGPAGQGRTRSTTSCSGRGTIPSTRASASPRSRSSP